jgi:hypothetical protein
MTFRLPWFGGLYVATVAALMTVNVLVPEVTDAWSLADMATLPLSIVGAPAALVAASVVAVLLPGDALTGLAVILTFSAIAYVQCQAVRVLGLLARDLYQDCRGRQAGAV